MKTLIILLCLSLSANAHAQNTTKNVKTDGGRFQLIQLNDMVKHQYLLDTQTGKLWNRVCGAFKGNECIYNIWEVQDVEGINISKEKMIKNAEAYDKMNSQAEPSKK